MNIEDRNQMVMNVIDGRYGVIDLGIQVVMVSNQTVAARA